MGGASFQRSRGASVPAARPGRALPSRGFTLIELLVTLSVAAVLLGIAMPSFSSFVKNSRLATEADTMVAALNLARSEAVKSDVTVDVCASSDGATCAASGSWAQGWIVMCPANCPAGLGGSPAVLLVYPAVFNGNRADELNSGTTTVSFSSTGQSTLGNLEFAFCDARGTSYGREVEVNSIGEISSSSTPGKTVSGAALGGC